VYSKVRGYASRSNFVGGRFVEYTLLPETEDVLLRESDAITEKPEAIGKSSVSGRIFSWLASDVGLLVLLAIVRVALHTATNGQYGFHRDELQTLDDARHLDWGFVVYGGESGAAFGSGCGDGAAGDECALSAAVSGDGAGVWEAFVGVAS